MGLWEAVTRDLNRGTAFAGNLRSAAPRQQLWRRCDQCKSGNATSICRDCDDLNDEAA